MIPFTRIKFSFFLTISENVNNMKNTEILT